MPTTDTEDIAKQLTRELFLKAFTVLHADVRMSTLLHPNFVGPEVSGDALALLRETKR